MSAVSTPPLELWSHRTASKKVVCAPCGRCWLTDQLSVQIRGGQCKSAPCVSTGSPAVWPMTDLGDDSGVELQRLEQGKGGGGCVRSLWIAAQADWQERNFLPTLPSASVFSFHLPKVKGSWAFTTAMCLPREVAVNGDKVLLKEQDFHAAPRIKPTWHRASPGRLLKQRVQWSLLIRPWQSRTEGQSQQWEMQVANRG